MLVSGLGTVFIKLRTATSALEDLSDQQARKLIMIEVQGARRNYSSRGLRGLARGDSI